MSGQYEPTPERTHDCPGDCGRTVNWARFACGPCWSRLPRSMRVAIKDAWGTRNVGDLHAGRAQHHTAMIAARHWYQDHPLWRDAP